MKILIDPEFNVQVLLTGINEAMVNQKVITSDSGVVVDSGNGEADGEMSGDVLDTETTVKDPLLSSWPFVIGISVVTLAVSIVIGILLAKRKIKKGFELYED